MCSDEFEPRTMITMTKNLLNKLQTKHRLPLNASIEKYTNNSLALKVSTPKGFLVVSEIFYPAGTHTLMETNVCLSRRWLRACILMQRAYGRNEIWTPLYGGMKVLLRQCCCVAQSSDLIFTVREN